jgi:hypothetical protein
VHKQTFLVVMVEQTLAVVEVVEHTTMQTTTAVLVVQVLS